jgi:hypothetical protein
MRPEAICRWCGKAYGEHLDARAPHEPQPRMPCLGLKAYFMEREEPMTPQQRAQLMLQNWTPPDSEDAK